MTDPFGIDPFADDVQEDNTPQETVAGPWDDTTDNTKEKIVVKDSEGKVVVTLKGGSGFEQSWIVVHADDFADAASQLEDVDNVKRLVTATRNAENFFHSTGQSQQKAAPAQRQGGGRPGKPAGATQNPSGEAAPDCKHGTMKYVSKVGAKGPWQAWMCPAPKDAPDQCKPQWIN